MVSVEEAVIARITRAGQRFELLVDPVLAFELRRGKPVPIDELLAVPEVFEDSRKGTRPTTELVNKAFGTNDIAKIAKIIITEGEVQLTTEQRRQMIEAREKEIANIIARQSINPQTGAPHPPERILRAMEQAHVHVSIEKSAEEQVETILKAIQPIIPIRFERIRLAIKIPPQYAARAAGIIRNFGSPSREEWGSDGSYLALLEIAAGLKPMLYDKLNRLTKGEVQIKEVKQ